MDQEERDEAREFSQIPPVSSAEASIPKDIKKRHQTYQVGLHRREHNARYLQLYPCFGKIDPLCRCVERSGLEKKGSLKPIGVYPGASAAGFVLVSDPCSTSTHGGGTEQQPWIVVQRRKVNREPAKGEKAWGVARFCRLQAWLPLVWHVTGAASTAAQRPAANGKADVIRFIQ
ncbi:hypothetical protein CIHG_01604 [Coccidioides immitis H538.4]|uniref:Uncharacterized protein n=3 Tax=Coccidioides immitis TaxID=5501 RepID=A0A0J8TNU2_COCIT|nr:hypothetical protein CIRG_01455 [Coccidioides immitis RMSCC 2394]KMU75397.1 hypothetical protein CISG_05032 [Coccidioides immitis RMSCC 3703]KMU83820.1 hypothetical protein CIHG_01604 [Coccidioides immitis H538.4]